MPRKMEKPSWVDLPPGLKYHCADCMIVVPSDAPAAPAGSANCAAVVAAKLTWFDPNETRAAQHIMAAAAWCLIHEAALKHVHPASVEYRRRMHQDRKALYAESHVRKSLAAGELEAEVKHRRDGWLHK